MYILEAPDDVQAVVYGISDYLSDMIRRAFFCVTAFLAVTDVLPWNAQGVVAGVQAQYLLGLGKRISVVGRRCAAQLTNVSTPSNRHW